MIDLDSLTVGQLKEVSGLLRPTSSEHSLPVGKNIIVRTVTHYYTGKLVTVTASDIVLEDAAWIPDTGRWSAVLSGGSPNEVELFLDPVIISRGAIVDVTLWRCKLPQVTK